MGPYNSSLDWIHVETIGRQDRYSAKEARHRR